MASEKWANEELTWKTNVLSALLGMEGRKYERDTLHVPEMRQQKWSPRRNVWPRKQVWILRAWFYSAKRYGQRRTLQRLLQSSPPYTPVPRRAFKSVAGKIAIRHTDSFAECPCRRLYDQRC